MSQQFVTFHVAGQIMGIPVDKVQEILPPQQVTNVPLSPNFIAGLINLRGQIVTSFDLRERLGLAPREPNSHFINIITGHAEDLYAIIVDSVGDVIDINQKQLAALPPTLDKIWRDCCDGVFQTDNGLLISLNTNNLFSILNNKT